jgi:hypothetical protein
VAFLAVLVVAIHLLWLALIIFGALWTCGRPVWTALHILALLWGIVAELGPWPCPLTLAESYLQARAGLPFYQSSFLLHYLDAIVYPNLPSWIVTSAGVAVCVLNLSIYSWRGWRWRKSHARSFRSSSGN